MPSPEAPPPAEPLTANGGCVVQEDVEPDVGILPAMADVCSLEMTVDPCSLGEVTVAVALVDI